MYYYFTPSTNHAALVVSAAQTISAVTNALIRDTPITDDLTHDCLIDAMDTMCILSLIRGTGDLFYNNVNCNQYMV
jgi:hypothetical protein